MPTTNRTPTLAEVIRVAFERRLMDVYVSMPGSIQSYDPVKQTATVLPLLRKLGPTTTGTDIVTPLPALQSVPVMFFGSGSWRITVPVSVGDQCLLVWADRGLDKWKGTQPASYDPTHTVDPASFNLHHIADSVAILGLVPPAAPRAATATDRMSIGSDGGAVAEFLPARINLGAGASQALVLGGQFQSHMTALNTALTNLSTALTSLSGAFTPFMMPPSAAAGQLAVAAAITAVSAAITATGSSGLAGDISSNSFTT